MQISEKMMTRFVRDRKIPLKLFVEPYFSSRIELYDKFFDTMQYWQMFQKELSQYQHEQDYYEVYNKIKESAMAFIKNSEDYIRFNENKTGYECTNRNFPHNAIYHPDNIGGTFISIDMKKANFSSLRHYSDNIFGKAKTWEEFMSNFTESEYMKSSKYIREVIFGNCNPKRHISYEKYLMDGVLSAILTVVDKGRIVSFGNDEIVVNVSNMWQDESNKVLQSINLVIEEKNFNFPLRVEMFYLIGVREINKDEPFGYVRLLASPEKGIDFKCVNSLMMPSLLKTILEKEITPDDLVFSYEDFIATRLDVPNIVFDYNNIPRNDILEMLQNAIGVYIIK